MEEMTKLLIGFLALLTGIPIGSYLAKSTGEELKLGRKWFKLIILLSLLGVLISLIAGNDILLFTLAFIAIVTSRSLKPEEKKVLKKK